jgi:hypothetical protein
MRAVRAALAALLVFLTGFLARAPALAGFFVVLALDEAAPAGFDVESVEVCPATGSATIRRAKAHASRRIEVGEVINLMLSLYAARMPSWRAGTNGVTAKWLIRDETPA